MRSRDYGNPIPRGQSPGSGVASTGGGGGSGSTTFPLTINTSGGAAPGATFNGASAKTIDFSTVGAQQASDLLAAYAGQNWAAGAQVPILTAADTVELRTIGAGAATQIIDRAAGDARYQPVGSYLTANQTITLSGDISGSGATAITTTIANGAVTLAKMANMATASLIYRKTAGSGAPEVNTLATLKTDLGLTGTNSGDQTITLIGDVTGSGTGSFAATIAANAVVTSKINDGAVTLAKQADMATASLVYRKTAGSGAPEVNSLATLKTDLGLTGTNSGDQFTGMTTSRILGRITAGFGAAEELTAANVKAILALASGDISGLTYFATGTDAVNLTGTVAAARMPALTGDVTTSAGSVATAIGANKVTYAMMQDVSASNRFLGRITASAGDPEELTGTQATTLLDTVTSALKGLAPASGGGTANFLRADATWAAPTVGAAGSSGQIQYNNGGALGGAVNYTIDASGNFVTSYATANTTPAADKIAFSPQRLLAGGGRVIPRWLSEEGVYISMQPHIGRNSVMFSHGQGTAATPTVIGGVLTNVGTLTARPPATTNRATRSKRTGYVSAATAGATAGVYAANANSTYYSIGSGTNADGGGFFAVFRWVESDAATVAGAHMFLGLSSTTAAPTATTNPNTFTNSVGVAQTNGGANLKIVYGGSAAQTEIDLGASFPASGHSTDEYELILYAPPNVNNKVYYRVERINTGDVATGTLTGTAGTVLPANTTFLGPRMFRSNNATALAVGLDIISFYIESDFS